MRILGVDTGGTFTDLVLEAGGETRVLKVASTPAEPAAAILAGLEALGGPAALDRVVHGTTVALNALLTGSVARTALVTNRGFRDLVEIGRQDRPDIYALHPRRPAPLVPRELRFEVDQRSWPDARTGELVEVQRPSRAALGRLARELAASGAESIAVCLLHSFADPGLELRVAEALGRVGVPVTCSAVLLPEHREVERFSTALVNAALVPRMRAYLGGLEARLGGTPLALLQSSGGTLPAGVAAEEPVRVLLSGPAGGVVGAARAAREAGLGRLVALDMGGTSTDVAFHDAGVDGAEGPEPTAAEPVRVAGHPVGVPTLDIHTIGCGGGSLVRVDAGGVLHVGPESAGADPGPVCYGRSDVPTVTDAHVFLGHVREGAFAGGLPLDRAAVERAFAELARRLGSSPLEAARGVLEVARAAMRRALGRMTMQRGQDPEALPLVAFGGAGGLHAATLAAGLGMPCALVPARPGVLSAWGMAGADATRDLARTVLEPLAAWDARARRRALGELGREARALLRAEGHAANQIELEHRLDLRYRGQSFEIRLGDEARAEEAFHRAHEELYGYRLPAREVELVCLRTRARVRTPAEPPRRVRARALGADAVRGTARADFGRWTRATLVDRDALRPGHRFEGPALVEEYSGTTLVPPGFRASVTAGGHLRLEPPRRR